MAFSCALTEYQLHIALQEYLVQTHNCAKLCLIFHRISSPCSSFFTRSSSELVSVSRLCQIGRTSTTRSSLDLSLDQICLIDGK